MKLPPITEGPEWSFRELHEKHPRFGILTKGNVILARVWMEEDAKAIAAVPVLLEALLDAREAIASMEEFALGGVDVADTATGDCVGQYGIRDELLAKIVAALRLAGAGDE